jgi:RNA polymerase sigma-70 factor (ECF subfamily)
MNEKIFVEKLKSGDRSAQEALIREYSDFLFNVVIQIVRKKNLAEDIVEDTLVSVLENIKTFRGQSTLKTWIYRIAVNKARAALIKEERADKLKIKVAEHQKLYDPEEIPKGFSTDKKKEIIWRGMGFLNEMEREIITLVDIEGMSYEEVSHLLGIPIGTVRSRISRARAHLKDIILEWNFFKGEVSN